MVMTTNGEGEEKATRSDEDLEAFEKQPVERKELQRLKDLAEKSVGREKAGHDHEIRRRSETEQG